jgi:CubicO group peptidase (beta-lactamase class C family)
MAERAETGLSDASGRLGQVAQLIQSWVDAGEVDGIAIALAFHDEQIAEFCVGNAAAGRRAQPDTLWPLASISKLYTAAAIMALVDRGALTLSLPVHAVLPKFTGGGKETVTVRHLLTHTAGLIYESPAMEQRLIAQTPIDELVEEAYLYPLMFQPGTRHSYSDYGFLLAGLLAAQVAGTSFAELVQTSIIEPAGLLDTYMKPPPAQYGRLAHVVGSLGYGTDGAMYNAPYALDLAHPAFGAVTTVADLMRFGMLFAPASRQRILSDAAIKAMTSDQTGGHVMGVFPGQPGAERPVQWGLGFIILTPGSTGPELMSPGSYGHGGASGCYLWVDPIAGVTFAYTSNKHGNLGRIPFTRRMVAAANATMAALSS